MARGLTLWPGDVGRAAPDPPGSGAKAQASGALFGGRIVDALGDAGRLAATIAQIIELGAAHLAAARALERIDHRRIDRKHALDAFAVGNLANREALLQAAAVARDADAFIGLNAGALAFLDLHIDDDGVAGLEGRDFGGLAKLGGLFGLDRLDDVHEKLHAVTPNERARRAKRFGALF